jgi:hypothetical protein
MLYEAICNLLQDQDLVVCQPAALACVDLRTASKMLTILPFMKRALGNVLVTITGVGSVTLSQGMCSQPGKKGLHAVLKT